jgi:hypothetical protein
MEQIIVNQYSKYHTVILGQGVPTAEEMGFFLLRCVKCGEVHEPNVTIGPVDVARKKYDEFWDQMEIPYTKKK